MTDTAALLDKNKESVSPRLLAIKEKINDEAYLSGAIARIAQVLSNEISGGEGKALKRKAR
jgi:hypothetical protein